MSDFESQNSSIVPNYNKFLSYCKQGNIVPVYKAVSADLLTPVLAYLKIETKMSNTFLLESVEGGEKIARYSFLGCNPYLIFRAKGDLVEIIKNDEAVKSKGSLLEIMRETLRNHKMVRIPGLPPFSGGAVGYLTYDAVRWIEDIPQSGSDDLDLDDSVMMLFSNILAFDHVRQQILIISNVFVDDQSLSLEAKYQKALEEIKDLEEKLNQPGHVPEVGSPVSDSIEIKSNFSKTDYLNAVKKAKEYIKAGDIFQVVLSQRFSVDVTAYPFNIYRALRVVNPSPYMFYLKINDLSVIGSSPEMLVKVSQGNAYYRPIAGTRPRGANEDEDAVLAEELRSDEKEKAEHIMLVDLGRNDLGKVCEFGSVETMDLMFVERYSHVMHLVSTLKGKLRQGFDRFDALMACFPAGTVSGAPKIRAMEIIDELESSKRKLYAGGIGYFTGKQEFDTCIALRTALIKDKKIYVQSGAGIVADSNPEKEYNETVNKAKALLKAIN